MQIECNFVRDQYKLRHRHLWDASTNFQKLHEFSTVHNLKSRIVPAIARRRRLLAKFEINSFISTGARSNSFAEATCPNKLKMITVCN